MKRFPLLSTSGGTAPDTATAASSTGAQARLASECGASPALRFFDASTLAEQVPAAAAADVVLSCVLLLCLTCAWVDVEEGRT